MSRRLALLLLLAPAALPAQPPVPVARPGTFLSPMGEPFRSVDPAADNVGAWFSAADGDRDGGLSLDEALQDAGRFFATLDRDGNGELGPAEIARYENDIAPEVQVGLQMRSEGFGDWRGRDSRRRKAMAFKKGINGAGRFAFLNIPQPVIAADFDMNRGVSSDEFSRAARQRFALLDKDGDSRLVRAELPPLPQPGARRSSSRPDEPVDVFAPRPSQSDGR